MVLYTCDLCQYKSEYLTRYNEHCMTRKHLRELESQEKYKNKVIEDKCQHNVNTTSTQENHRKLMSVDCVECHLRQGKVGAAMRKNIVIF